MSDFDRVMEYLFRVVGAPYLWWLWSDSNIQERAPAWALNAPAPYASEVVDEGCFCAGVPNLFIRYLIWLGYEIEIPGYYTGDEEWDGGVLAYQNNFWDDSRTAWFDASADYPDFTLLLQAYIEGSSQGHVAIVYQGKVLDSTATQYLGSWPGVVYGKTVAESSEWVGGYSIAIPPEVWLGVSPATVVEPPPPPPEEPEVQAGLTVELLMKMMPTSLSAETAALHVPYIRSAARRFWIDTRLQFAAWMANIAAETGELQWFQELDSYDGSYLINQPYYPYYGRGAIHLTWMNNYRAAGDYFGEDFVSNPEMVADPAYAWLVAGWFWRYQSAQGDLNVPAEAGDFDTTCLGVNGGWNGYQDRLDHYNLALSVLPEGFSPWSEGGPPTIEEEHELAWSKYTFAAIGEPYVDFANAAVLVLASMGVDAMAVQGSENTAALGKAALDADDVGVLNCIPIGKAAYEALSPVAKSRYGWTEDSIIWSMEADTDAGVLNKVEEWALRWIAEYGEKDLNFDELLTNFELALKGAYPAYRDLIEAAHKDTDLPTLPDPPPPPPPVEMTMEERVAKLEEWRRSMEGKS